MQTAYKHDARQTNMQYRSERINVYNKYTFQFYYITACIPCPYTIF